MDRKLKCDICDICTPIRHILKRRTFSLDFKDEKWKVSRSMLTEADSDSDTVRVC